MKSKQKACVSKVSLSPLISPTFSIAKICLAGFIALSSQASAQVVVADEGVAFGAGDEDPLLRKSAEVGVNDLQLDVAQNGVFSIFSGLDTTATFRAGEGNSATVTAGKWYRIAKSIDGSDVRTNALFSLNESGGSSVTFRTGMSNGSKEQMAFTLLSNSRYNDLVFSEVRYLSNGASSEHYLEVKVDEDSTVAYSIMENLSAGWVPVDWVETISIPAGYRQTKYDLDKRFVVAGENSILSVDRTTGVDVDGDLRVNGLSVLTSVSPLAFGNSLAEGESSAAFGDGTSASGENSVSFGLSTRAEGDEASAFGSFTAAVGINSTAFGNSTSALADNALAVGDETTISQYAGFTIGRFNEDIGTEAGKTSWVGDDLHSVFEIGIGSGPSDRKNAMSVMQDGTI